MKINQYLITVFFCYTALDPAYAARSDESLCTPEELQIASCSLKKGDQKIASICTNKESGNLLYYFGTETEIDLKVDLSRKYRLYRWIDPVTSVTFLGFDRGGYSYVIGIPQEKPGASAFLLVKKSGSALDLNHPKICKNNSFGDKDWVEHIVDVEKRVPDESFIFPPTGISNK